MIHRIYSSLRTFKALELRPGLNVLLAEKSEGATKRQTRNRAGKTSVVEIVHFLTGLKIDKKSLFKADELNEVVFGMEFDLAGKPVTLGKFVGELAHASNRRRPRLSAPGWLVALGVDALRLVSPVTRWKPPVTGKGVRHGGALYDGTKASRELGLEYTTLREALESTVRWYTTERGPSR